MNRDELLIIYGTIINIIGISIEVIIGSGYGISFIWFGIFSIMMYGLLILDHQVCSIYKNMLIKIKKVIN